MSFVVLGLWFDSQQNRRKGSYFFLQKALWHPVSGAWRAGVNRSVWVTGRFLILNIQICYMNHLCEGRVWWERSLFFLTERWTLSGSEGLVAGLGWWRALDQQSSLLVGPQSPQGWGLVQSPLGIGLRLHRTVRGTDQQINQFRACLELELKQWTKL